MTGTDEREDKLLGAMLGHEMHGKATVSFMQLAKDLKFMERTTTWRNSWKALMNDKKYIEVVDGKSVFTSECRMTQAGKDHASTPEYEDFLKELNFIPQTNEDHHDHIKKRLKNAKGVAIFDLLLAHGSLSRKELSTILQCNDRQHLFSNGLKDLKAMGYVEKDKKFRLSDKAFLDPHDRPETVPVDAKVLEEGAKVVESKKRSGGGQQKAEGDKESKPKKKQEKSMEADPDESPAKKQKLEAGSDNEE